MAALFPNNVFHSSKFLVNSQLFSALLKRRAHRYVVPTLLEIKRREKKAEPLPIEKTKRSNYTDWNYNAELFAFGKRLGEEFKIELLLQSFVNKSYIDQERLKQEQVGIENPQFKMEDNSQLAEKGEKIISKYVLNYLSRSLPRYPLEGILAVHDYLLSDEILAHISKNLGTNDIIFSAEYPPSIATFSKTLKALVGCLVESQSIERAGLFIRDLIITHLHDKDVNELFLITDPFNVVGEILGRDRRAVPEPRIIGQSAMNDLLANYHVGLYADRQLLGHGPGETVETAVEMAARDVLKRFFNTKNTFINFGMMPELDERVKNVSLKNWKLSVFE